MVKTDHLTLIMMSDMYRCPLPSESGSFGNSSDSSGRPQIDVTPRHEPALAVSSIQQQPLPQPAVDMMEMTNVSRTTFPKIKVTRLKGKRACKPYVKSFVIIIHCSALTNPSSYLVYSYFVCRCIKQEIMCVSFALNPLL